MYEASAQARNRAAAATGRIPTLPPCTADFQVCSIASRFAGLTRRAWDDVARPASARSAD